jgi:hypothetical protein
MTRSATVARHRRRENDGDQETQTGGSEGQENLRDASDRAGETLGEIDSILEAEEVSWAELEREYHSRPCVC